MNQRGFILPSPTLLMIGAIGILLLAVSVQTWRLDRVQTEYGLFKGTAEQLGKIAAQHAKEMDERNSKTKKEADDENTRLRTTNAAIAKRLRDASTNRYLVPAIPDATGSTETACFDRTQLDNALRDFVGEAREIAISGQEAVTDLDTAKKWASQLH